MKTLKCNGKEILIEDFFLDKNLCTIDIKFSTKEAFKDFVKVYSEHISGKGVFHFEIGDNSFDGWFGQMLYDKKYNVRVYIGIYDEIVDMKTVKDGKTYSVEKSLIGISNSIRELCRALSNSDILDEEASNKIIEMMKTPETLVEFSSMVDDLPLYLKERNETIVGMRG